MFRSHVTWYLPVTLSLICLGISGTQATAQTTLDFNAKFNASSQFAGPPQGSVVPVLIAGSTSNAPLDLSQLSALSYDPLAGIQTGGPFIFSTDPAVLGAPTSDPGSFTLSSSGGDSLLGNFTGTESIDFSTFKASFTADVTITGGTGRLTGATGNGTFSGIFQLNPLDFSGQGPVVVNTALTIPRTVSEPSTILGTVSVALGLGGLMIKKKFPSLQKSQPAKNLT